MGGGLFHVRQLIIYSVLLISFGFLYSAVKDTVTVTERVSQALAAAAGQSYVKPSSDDVDIKNKDDKPLESEIAKELAVPKEIGVKVDAKVEKTENEVTKATTEATESGVHKSISATGRTIIVSGGNEKGTAKTKTTSPMSALEGQTCNIPKLDINGSEVIKFFVRKSPLNCHKKFRTNWVFINDEGHFEFVESRKSAKCEITYYLRKDDNSNTETKPERVKEGTSMKEDFGMISCTAEDGHRWGGYLMSAVHKQAVEDRAKKAERPKDSSDLNVFFLGFDSVSQMTFRRKLPKTVEFIEKVLGSVVLNGYNIVGDGTPQAFIPILTSKTETELPLTRKRYGNANYVDDVYPFIWRNFSDAGYVTNYAEDAWKVGTFTYRLKGFRNQPTDHYTRPIFRSIERTRNWYCHGSIPFHQNWFRYGREFMRAYPSLPRFSLMHQSLLSHDDINLVGVEDDDLAAFLKKMNDEGMFDNTVVILMADHGHRFAQLRNTHQGQLEERLPFFSLALPPKFIATERGAKAYENLKTNKDRLSSPFDIHSTLMDIIHWPTKEQLSNDQDTSNRSMSLFRPIPESRTCDQAGIAPHWCTCLNWEDALKDEAMAAISRSLAQNVVDAMNEQIKDVTKLCAPLKLKELIEAKRLAPNEGVLKYRKPKDKDGFVPNLGGNVETAFAYYQLKLATTPGRGIYEITMYYDRLKDTVHVDLGAMSHTSKFGDDPHCIIDQNYFLATYCVCYDKI